MGTPSLVPHLKGLGLFSVVSAPITPIFYFSEFNGAIWIFILLVKALFLYDAPLLAGCEMRLAD